jgi:phage terminase large subunit GpA-like protein
MQDAISERGIWKVVFMTSAQVGKSLALTNIIGYHIDYDPCPMLMLQPTLEMAEAFSKDRIATMVRDTPCLSKKLDVKSRSLGNTLLHKVFPGGHLTLAGANSAASLASRPIRIVLADEVDRYPPSAGTEGDPLMLAVKRTNNFWNRKIICVSTPTISGQSRIEREFEEGDERHFEVPCPYCGTRQSLVWERLRWTEENPETVSYVCEECSREIPESEKASMLSRGAWHPRKPTNGIASFHLSELYSPWKRWHEIVRDYLAARTNTLSPGDAGKRTGASPTKLSWATLKKRDPGTDFETSSPGNSPAKAAVTFP